MNIFLWILQVLLAAFFLMAGLGKLSGSRDKHIADGHIHPGDSLIPIYILGVLELLGCVGIIIPWLTGIAPVLTPLSAIGFGCVMMAGIVVHTRKKEYKMLPLLLAVLTMAAVVAYYRLT